MRIRNDTVRTNSLFGSGPEKCCHSEKLNVWNEPSVRLSTTWACPWNSKVSARRAEQTFTACHRRLSTSTCWLSIVTIRMRQLGPKLHKRSYRVNERQRRKR